MYSVNGYRRYSKDVDNAFNIIPSDRISMKGVDFPVIGVDEFGIIQFMQPEKEYQFPGNTVFEVPIKQAGGSHNAQSQTKKPVTQTNDKRDYIAENNLSYQWSDAPINTTPLSIPSAYKTTKGGSDSETAYINPIQEQLRLAKLALKTFDSAADDQLRALYNTTPHQVLYEYDEDYRNRMDYNASQNPYKIEYPKTDLRRGDNIPPNTAWMYPNLTGQTRAAMTTQANQDLAFDIMGAGMASKYFKGANSTNKVLKNVDNTTDLIGDAWRMNNSNNIVKNKFKSEIDWRKWNKEIPENKALIQEYNAIEQAFKETGTWMKNPDGSVFKGTPEQFVQQNSENFKKAFPNGYKTVYRGEMAGDAHLTGDVGNNRTIFTADKETGQHYAGSKGKLFELYHPESANNLSFNNNGRSWRNISRNHFGENPPELDVLSGRLNTPQTGNYTSTDDIAKWIEDNNKDYVNINNIFDGTDAEFVRMVNHKKGNYLKSLVGNNGMFDMNNPNIYKSIIPAIATAGAIGASQKKYQSGGTAGMDGMMKARLALDSHFGNPTARRMTNYDTRNYKFDDGSVGNVYVSSYDNLVTPHIQLDENNNLIYVDDVWSDNNKERSYQQSMKFEREEDAEYFGKNYKRVAPMKKLYQDGGYAQEEDPTTQLLYSIAEALQQGSDPREVLNALKQNGVPEEQAMELIKYVMEQMQQQDQLQKEEKQQLEYAQDGKIVRKYNVEDLDWGKGINRAMLAFNMLQTPGLWQTPVKHGVLDALNAGLGLAAGLSGVGLGYSKLGAKKEYLGAKGLEPMKKLTTSEVAQTPEITAKNMTFRPEYLTKPSDSGISFSNHFLTDNLNQLYNEHFGKQLSDFINANSENINTLRSLYPDEDLSTKQDGGYVQEEDPTTQLLYSIAEALQQGSDPREILNALKQNGVPEEQAMELIKYVMEQMQQQDQLQKEEKQQLEYAQDGKIVRKQGDQVMNMTFMNQMNPEFLNSKAFKITFNSMYPYLNLNNAESSSIKTKSKDPEDPEDIVSSPYIPEGKDVTQVVKPSSKISTWDWQTQHPDLTAANMTGKTSYTVPNNEEIKQTFYTGDPYGMLMANNALVGFQKFNDYLSDKDYEKEYNRRMMQIGNTNAKYNPVNYDNPYGTYTPNVGIGSNYGLVANGPIQDFGTGMFMAEEGGRLPQMQRAGIVSDKTVDPDREKTVDVSNKKSNKTSGFFGNIRETGQNLIDEYLDEPLIGKSYYFNDKPYVYNPEAREGRKLVFIASDPDNDTKQIDVDIFDFNKALNKDQIINNYYRKRSTYNELYDKSNPYDLSGFKLERYYVSDNKENAKSYEDPDFYTFRGKGSEYKVPTFNVDNMVENYMDRVIQKDGKLYYLYKSYLDDMPYAKRMSRESEVPEFFSYSYPAGRLYEDYEVGFKSVPKVYAIPLDSNFKFISDEVKIFDENDLRNAKLAYNPFAKKEEEIVEEEPTNTNKTTTTTQLSSKNNTSGKSTTQKENSVLYNPNRKYASMSFKL